MPYLRCEQCGAKALPIASRCPSCEHPFPSRAGHGHAAGGRGSGERSCPDCDSIVSRDAVECRWCGTPLDTGLSKRAIGGIGTAAAVAILAAGFHFWGPNADVVVLSGSGDSAPRAAEIEPFQRAPAPGTPPAVDEPSEPEERAEPQLAASSEVADSAEPTTVDEDPAPAEASGSWVRAVARTFVNIRSAPSSDGAIQGVVPENQLVLLGDAQGTWRRVRTDTVTGWAWEPLFNLDGGS